MKVKDFLREGNWTNKHLAVTDNGVCVHPDDTHANKYCLIGAIAKCYKETERLSIYNRINDYLKQHYPTSVSIMDFNDNVSFNKVKTMVEELDI